MRLFVALELPDPLRRQAAAVGRRIAERAGPAARSIRWARPEQIHLTLQFLGEVAEGRLGELRGAVAGAAERGNPLRLEAAGAGAFPDPRRPRVVWLGIGGDLEGLAELARELGRRLEPLGFPPDARPFRPHLTLGRARGGARGLGEELARAAAERVGEWEARELVLFRSHLGSGGARHEPLLRAPLGGASRDPGTAHPSLSV